MSVLILKNSYFVDRLGLVPRVKSLVRDVPNRRWKIAPTNDNGHVQLNFPDDDYGGAAESCSVAIRTIRQISVVLKPKTRTIVNERKDKHVPLNCPGVSVRAVVCKRSVRYYLTINNPVNNIKERIFVGTDKDVMDHWIDAVSRARSIRSGYLYRKRMKARLAAEDELIIMSL